MSTVIVTIVTTATPLPAGATFGQYSYNIFAADGTTLVANEKSPNETVTFPSVAPGSYVASVEALDSTGAVLGTPVTATFAVAAPATFGAPSSVTVTVQ